MVLYRKAMVIGLALLLLAGRAAARVEARAEGLYIDGEYFYPVGVNYMPRDGAVYMWKDFDPEAVRTEFRALRGMGLNTVRTFAYWEDLNPEPDTVSASNLDQIQQLLDVAQEEGIMVVLTLYTGHMSGCNWFPEWMKKGGDERPGVFRTEPFRPPQLRPPRTARDIYEDELAIENALLQARAAAERFKDHSALLYWDFANEPQYWQRPRTPELAQAYVDRIVREIKKYDPNHPVAFGMGKFLEDTGFHSFGDLGINRVEDIYLVHTYPSGYFPASAKTVDTWTSYYAGFENSISRAAGLPVQFQEFGLSNFFLAAMGNQERDFRMAGYYRCGLWGAALAGATSGSLAWMSGDYRLSLILREPYISHPWELTFGVMDREYRPKPSGEELAKFAAVMKEIATRPLTPHFDPVAIILPETYLEYPAGPDREGDRFLDTHRNHNRFLFAAWVALRQNGVNPVFAERGGGLAGARLVIMPPWDADTDGTSRRAGSGAVVYRAGAEDQLELETAVNPGPNLDALRERYGELCRQAGITPRVRADDPFVETGLIGGRYLVAINHREDEVETEIFLNPASKVVHCWYGASVGGSAGIVLRLPGLGTEVCELGE